MSDSKCSKTLILQNGKLLLSCRLPAGHELPAVGRKQRRRHQMSGRSYLAGTVQSYRIVWGDERPFVLREITIQVNDKSLTFNARRPKGETILRAAGFDPAQHDLYWIKSDGSTKRVYPNIQQPLAEGKRYVVVGSGQSP